MTITTARILVEDTATELASGLKNAILYAYGTCFVGGSDVTVSNGLPVLAGSPFPVPIGIALGEKIYGICAAGQVEVRVLRYSPL